jgi:RNA polymerase sigma-70 factor (ECF subfamily)
MAARMSSGRPTTTATEVSPTAARQRDRAVLADPLADPDVRLMLAVQAGDESAFRSLFRRYSGRILAYVGRMVGHGARAEELTQDVFIQVFRFRQRYRPESRLSTWIFRIATNVCLNELRRPEHRLRVDLWAPESSGDEAREVQRADPDALSPEDVAAASELGRALGREIEALPPKQRAALVLARVDGLPYKDVAEVLGCTEGAVKALIFRATQGLKERLKDLL